jgi:hypothetical protein
LKLHGFFNWKNQAQKCIGRTSFYLFIFKESKLGPKVLFQNRNRTTLVRTPIFVRGNPGWGMGHKGPTSRDEAPIEGVGLPFF